MLTIALSSRYKSPTTIVRTLQLQSEEPNNISLYLRSDHPPATSRPLPLCVHCSSKEDETQPKKMQGKSPYQTSLHPPATSHRSTGAYPAVPSIPPQAAATLVRTLQLQTSHQSCRHIRAYPAASKRRYAPQVDEGHISSPNLALSFRNKMPLTR
jgi:hypothetical protein